MIRYVIRSLSGRAGQAILLTFAALVVSITYPLFITASQSIKVTADQNLERYWRTTYDILVRPKGSRTPIEEKYGLVEANHLSNIWGGISFAQYEAIKSIPAVEVAAPVAMLGHLAIPIVTPIELPHEPGTTILIKQLLTVDNGLRQIVFEAQSPRVILTRGQHAVSFDPQEGAWLESFPIDRADHYNLPLTAFALIAAVDPEEEARLIGLDDCLLEGNYLTASDETFEISDSRGVMTRRPAEQETSSESMISPPAIWEGTEETRYLEIPILLNAHMYVDVNGKAMIYKLRSSGVQEYLYSQPINFYRQMLDVFLSGEVRGRNFYPVYPLPRGVEYREMITPTVLMQGSHILEALPARERGGISSWTATGKTPEIKPLFIVEIEAFYGQGSGEVAFRAPRTRKDNEQFSNLAVTFDVKGIFDIDELQHLIGDPNSVPFETYFPPLAVLKYDEEGNPTPPLTLKPSLSPHGYLLSPPIALTNMKAAHVLAGEAAISAIRVRVGDIEKLDQAAQAKIEAVASEIYRRTGLDVDIMVGSSPQRILVHIPGDEDAPAIGYVEEYWIKKNVNALIGQSLNKANLAFFAAMLLTCALSMASIFFTASLARTREVGLLKALGWHSRTVFAILLAEALLVGLVAAPLGFSSALGFAELLGLSLPLKQALLILPLSLTLLVVGSFYPAWNAAGLSPVIAIQRGEVRPKAIGKLSLLSYAARGPLRRPARSLVALGTMIVFAAFLMLILLAIGASRGYLVGTLLGEHVLQRVEGYHYLLVALCSLFSALAVGDLVWMNTLERRREIGVLKAIGWRSGGVFKAFVLEAAVLGLIGGVLGCATAIATFWRLYGMIPPSLLWITPVGLALPTLVSAIAALYPAWRAAQITPTKAVRCE